MRICVNDLLYATSYALDCVEQQLVGVTDYHSNRVAYMAVQMGLNLGMDEGEALRLAAAAVLHDNALTEYLHAEFQKGVDSINGKGEISLKDHCLIGEKNIQCMPFYQGLDGTIQYHHENADGSGPFKKKYFETPLFARLIHLTDSVDVLLTTNGTLPTGEEALEFVHQNRGILFDEEMAEAFEKTFDRENLKLMTNENIGNLLRGCLPIRIQEYTADQLLGISQFFAKIIDYKSKCTCNHSLEVAEKAKKMAGYYHFDEDTQAKIYFAGSLHDIGKLIVDTELLEKPDRLTKEEYQHVQYHALETYKILSSIEGMEEITSWASYHHEKLNGTGYPFGKTAEALGQIERLMACVDIYQALIEKRPYKDNMSHRTAIALLRKMAEKGELDKTIVEDIDKCFGDKN